MKLLKTALLASAFVGISSLAGAFAVTENGSAEATIVSPLSLSNQRAIKFGNIVPSGTIGEVTVTWDGVRSTTGGAAGAGGTVIGGYMKAFGTAAATYTISPVPDTTVDSGGDSMVLKNITPRASSTGLATGGVLNGSGQDDIFFGGTLEVGVNQPAGDYVGTYVVTANYP